MYKAIKDNKIIAVSDTDSEFKFLLKDVVASDLNHITTDYTMVGSEYVLNSDEKAIEAKKEQVRAVRNSYLEETDKYISIPDFPISEEEKENYKTYRTYLRDYTELENWWESEPLNYEDWKEKEAN